MPQNEIIDAAHIANPHGCGLVSPSVFYKGTSYKSFMHALACVSDDEPCIMHFRFATHGSVKVSNCHPFCIDDVYFAHNGILNIQPDGDKTDSEAAFEQIIYPAIKEYGYGSQEMHDAAFSILGCSRFAILKGDHIYLYGDYEHRDGCYYSNLRFWPYVGRHTRLQEAF